MLITKVNGNKNFVKHPRNCKFTLLPLPWVDVWRHESAKFERVESLYSYDQATYWYAEDYELLMVFEFRISLKKITFYVDIDD